MTRGRSPWPPNETTIRNVVADARPSGRHDRQAAGETDADDADAAVGGVLRLSAQPGDGVLDDVGGLRRNAIPHQVRQRHRHHPHPGSGEVLRQRGQTRFGDAERVDARNEEHGALHRPLRLVELPDDISGAGRHLVRWTRDDAWHHPARRGLGTTADVGGARRRATWRDHTARRRTRWHSPRRAQPPGRPPHGPSASSKTCALMVSRM